MFSVLFRVGANLCWASTEQTLEHAGAEDVGVVAIAIKKMHPLDRPQFICQVSLWPALTSLLHRVILIGPVLRCTG